MYIVSLCNRIKFCADIYTIMICAILNLNLMFILCSRKFLHKKKTSDIEFLKIIILQFYNSMRETECRYLFHQLKQNYFLCVCSIYVSSILIAKCCMNNNAINQNDIIQNCFWRAIAAELINKIKNSSKLAENLSRQYSLTQCDMITAVRVNGCSVTLSVLIHW